MIKNPFSHSNRVFNSGFYRSSDFDFEIRGALGKATSGSTDAGEVLATIAGIEDGDHQAWFDSWLALGIRVRAIGDACAEDRHFVSAAEAYLRASSYFGLALGGIDGLKNTDPLPTFRQHRACWDRFVDTTPFARERVAIPYDGMTMPGYIFKASADAVPRPTLIVVNGSDGLLSSLWGCTKAALARGYMVLLFDGPGQQSMLFEQGVPFRYDWERVITPIVNFLLTREDVRKDKLAMYGVSQAGYWVPRALAFEHRIAAAIADPGVVDVSTSWVTHLPKSMMKLVAAGNARLFDVEMAIAMKMSPETSRVWNFRAKPYRQDSYFDTIREVMKYDLTDVAGQITTPMLITDPDDEQFWPGQSKRLAELLPGEKMVAPFTAAEGANYHCQPMARTLTEQRMFDWLDDLLGRSA